MSTEMEPEIPKWREDFPYETEGDEFITRRDFTRFLLLISAAFVTGNAWILLKSFRRRSLAPGETAICRTDEIAPGNWRMFNYPNEKTPAILIHRESGEFAAFQQKCTHLACPVAYERSQAGKGESLTCHCHNGRFNIATGEGIGGPPRELRPLPRIKLRIEGNRILATGVALGSEHA